MSGSRVAAVSLRPPDRERARQIAIALLAIALTTLVRHLLNPILGESYPFGLYYVPLILIAWYCGPMPTILAAIVAMLAAIFFFVPPAWAMRIDAPRDQVATLTFTLVAGTSVFLARKASATRAAAERSLDAARRAQRAAEAAVWDWSLAGTILPSEDLSRLFGVDAATFVPPEENFRALIHEEDAGPATAAVDEARRTGGPFYIEYRVATPSRGERWLASKGEVYHDAAGRAYRISGITVDVTDRRRAEARSATLAAIVESTDDGVIGLAIDGTITSWNPAAERIFGYKAAEAVGQPITLICPPPRSDEMKTLIEAICRGERRETFETERLAKDGRLIPVSVTTSPIRDARGVVIGASKIVRDITARKTSEAALAAQREWFRVTLASIGDAVIASDCAGRVTFMNPVSENLTGWRADEGMARPVSEVFHILNEKTREEVENPIDKVMRHGHIVGLANHTALIGRDGVERPIADSAAPILDDDGRLIGVVLVFHDVTAERRAAEAVAEQREWLEKTLESIGDAVIATDVRGRITFMNPIAEHLTGWKATEAKDKDCGEVFRIISEVTRQEMQNPVGRVLREGIVVGLANHTLLLAADGTERPIDDSGAPIRNRDGRIVGVVLVFRDVSERREHESERQAAMRERGVLLESERAARAEAERANRLKDEFVATLSHELRTPLTSILGWTRLLQEKKRDEATVRRGLEVIDRNSRAQARLISDLLDMSRILSGKMRLDMDAVDMTTVIGDAVDALRPAADAKRITLERSIDATLGPMLGDAARLQQIVWNLVSNAIKFTPDKGKVTIALRRVESHVELSVADTGIGIRAEIVPLLFNRFRQGDSSTARRHGGLGLGLAIVKQLAELHGGTVRAESAGDVQGATFTVALPLSLTRAPAPPAAAPEERVPGSADLAGRDISLGGLKVLLVEDEPDTRDLLQRLLEDRGAEVFAAASASQALEAIARVNPDILVSDIGLPEIDGYELMRRIRGLDPSAGGRIPAIALTAFARADDRTRALRAGYQVHLGKPVDPAELIATLASFSGIAEDAKPDQRPRGPEE